MLPVHLYIRLATYTTSAHVTHPVLMSSSDTHTIATSLQAYRQCRSTQPVNLLCITFNSVTCWPTIQVLRAGLALRRGQYSTAAGILAGRQPDGAEVSPLELIAATQDSSACNAAALPRVQVCISFKCGRHDVIKRLGKGLGRISLAVHLFDACWLMGQYAQ